MSLPIVFRLEAQTEFDEAIDWYEQQAELGLEFLDYVADTLAQIQAMPKSYETVFEDVRRAVVQRFPYSVFYQVETQKIVVLAVFHSKRNPKIWQARV
ncbi:MAG: type II toxin-antitoxin system RelE/ParE family toxin [Pegethrix bostrychoides GSE-TBD4-15B]|jgi:plasmid stabilization system protein ParE|uniref:Type II toxin-antitoxin system RelE/ParE family toxin n=1 Tax=Pegethrix bostrychoides GSE-TBD4-15B TaxID=2839662 RepID=A0A951PH52_9CYAN|nr:type II toxin-antitoxin system RelE/ParE family toxin [Pegethrix bostrychoides GSE-TBD4-15B]